MKRLLKTVLISAVILSAFCGLSYSEPLDLTAAVDEFKQATDLQRLTLVNDYFGRDTSAGGLVVNVDEYNFFNEKKDVTAKFYRIITQEQKTDSGTPYQVIFLFKNLDQVKDVAKGQVTQNSGKIIRIIDERLQISVWIYIGELTDKDKELLK